MSENSDKKNGIPETETQHGVVVQEKEKVERPSQFKVILLNDDYTPMDFVIHVLKVFFQKDEKSAYEIMMQVHTQGKGLAGVFSYEIAETKVAQVRALAKKNQHPLRCILERETLPA